MNVSTVWLSSSGLDALRISPSQPSASVFKRCICADIEGADSEEQGVGLLLAS
jgi:hypothetical protein